MTAAKHIIYKITFLIFVINLTCPEKAHAFPKDSLYNIAYTEISEMLDGKRPLSIKRAAFLAEWAYLDGELDYEKDMCQPIAEIVDFINKLITVNNTWGYKTAVQIALTEFFFNPWSGNNYTPFTYDYGEELPRDDFRRQFVAQTLKTHKGQCRSLPLTFKILAEEFGAEVHINLAPRHTYITYPDLDDRYPEDSVYVELTTHQIAPLWCIKDNFKIKDEAIKAGTYMKPLTNEETIAFQLSELALGYWTKYKDTMEDDDIFLFNCVSKSLDYLPMDPNAIIMKGKYYDGRLRKYLKYNHGHMDYYAQYLLNELKKSLAELDATHWTYISDEESKKFYEIPKDYNPTIIMVP